MDVVPTPSIDERIQAWDLGLGESSVLTWGYTHQGTEIIIDDLAARRCATALGIPFRGTSCFGCKKTRDDSIGTARS